MLPKSAVYTGSWVTWVMIGTGLRVCLLLWWPPSIVYITIIGHREWQACSDVWPISAHSSSDEPVIFDSFLVTDFKQKFKGPSLVSTVQQPKHSIDNRRVGCSWNVAIVAEMRLSQNVWRNEWPIKYIDSGWSRNFHLGAMTQGVWGTEVSKWGPEAKPR